MGVKKIEEMLTSSEVKKLLKWSDEALKEARDTKGFPFYPVSKKDFRYRASEIETWLQERKKNG